MALPCTNCGKSVEQKDAKLFSQVFVCEGCLRIANRVLEVGDRELRRMQSMLKDAVQLAIIQKRLGFTSEDHVREDPTVVLAKLTQLLEQIRNRQCQTKLSTQSTKLNARIAAGKRSSRSLVVVDSPLETSSEEEPSEGATDANGK